MAESLTVSGLLERLHRSVTCRLTSDSATGIRVSGVRVRKLGKLTFDPSLAPASVDRCTPAAPSALGDLTASTARQADTHPPTRRAGLIASHPSQDAPARRRPGSPSHAPRTSSVQLAPRKQSSPLRRGPKVLHRRSRPTRQPLPLQPLQHRADIQVDPFGNFHQLDDVHPALTVFDLRHVGLWASKPGGKFGLRHATGLSRSNHLDQELLVRLRVCRFHQGYHWGTGKP